jgi:hypothetical protein
MTLDASGNLGIGTSTPAFALDISQAAPRIRQTASTGTNSSLIQLVNTGGTAYVGLDSSTAGLTAAYSLNLYHSGAYPIVFSTNNTERMRLDSAGNLGLGVAPSASWFSGSKVFQFGATGALWTNGANNSAFSHNAVFGDASTTYQTTGVASYYRQLNGAHNWLTAPSGTAGNAISFSQVMTLDASGRLLVGYTSGFDALQVNGSISSQGGGYVGFYRNGATNNTSTVDGVTISQFGISSGVATGRSDASTWVAGFDSLRLVTQGTERARIDSSGSLLVGTTTSAFTSKQEILQTGTNPVAYFFRNNAAAGAGFVLRHGGATGAATATQVDFLRADSVAVGSITSTVSATAYNTSSDYRLKDITGPVTNSGAYIDSLNPVEGTWKADGSTFVGLIAHEVQEASRTQVATGTKDGEEMQAMDYSNAELIANLIAEVKSLRARLAAANI